MWGLTGSPFVQIKQPLKSMGNSFTSTAQHPPDVDLNRGEHGDLAILKLMNRILGLREPGLDAADRLQEPSIGRYRWYWERRVRRNLQSRARRTAASDVTY